MENIQAFAYEIGKNGAKIWRCFSRDTRAVVPEYIGELKVTEIMPYAFSGHMDEEELQRGLSQGKIKVFSPLESGESKDRRLALCGDRLEEIVLSQGIVRIGRYCFYNCENLKSIRFTDSVRDWGSGAFTGCHQVKRISILMENGETSTLKDVLAELHEELCVEYELKNQPADENECQGEKNMSYAKLYFPEYYEEGVENTPARILETHVHGSGLYYRNCFLQRQFNFQEYDSRFVYARAQESFDFLAHMAMARLRFPYKLSDAGRKRYESYVREMSHEFAAVVIKEREISSVKWLAELAGTESEELTDCMVELAGKSGYAEGMSWLMDFKHRKFGGAKKKRRFVL